MIQPEPEGSTQGYPLVSVEVLRYDKRSKSEIKGRMQTEMELTLEQTQQGVSYEVSMLSDIEDSHGPEDAIHRPFHHSKSEDFGLNSQESSQHFYQLSHSELVDIEKVALSSSLRSLKSKCTVESRAKRDHL
ncbi:hypothetical protein Tco_0476342 [Tanacetum coccineum]